MPAKKDQRDCTAEDLNYATMSMIMKKQLFSILHKDPKKDEVELCLKLTDVKRSDP